MEGGPTLLSDCRGALRRMLFVFSEGLLAHEPQLVDILLAIPCSWCAVTIIAPKPRVPWVKERLRQHDCASRADIIDFDGDGPSAWSQDPFLVRRDSSGGQSLVFGSNRSVCGGLDGHLAKARGYARVVSISSPIDGGNILAGEASLLVGADLALRWKNDGHDPQLGESCPSDLETARKFIVIKGQAPIRKERPQRWFRGDDHDWREDRDVALSTNGTYQPLFHIDMFISLAGAGPDGRERVLVGDPRMAAEITGLPLPAGFQAEPFDEIAQSLTEKNLAVWRNPLPIIAVDNDERKTRNWIPLSYNNCLVQKSSSKGDMVWLPQYGNHDGLAEADRENHRIWRELGFEASSAGNFLSVARRLGSLRCLAKVLERDEE